ncbi:MAG: methylenetetrahydrofolate reductase C-terminal domain-containing protein [Candidatus Bathyarchaeota archaeon]|nr:MAG: methylenetetrahydrofolate reductase C-terminal domain-containing protein [Candidatus Bathyarchaeota archaeon]
MASDFRRLLIVGCDGCASIIQAGGEKQAKVLKALLEMERRLKGKQELRTKATSILRQCDRQIVTTSLHPLVDDYDAVISLSCGVGVQTLAELFPDKTIIPANDTKFIGMHDTKAGKFYEMCRACGDCILFETSGICPITLCAKSLVNGPCGGHINGKCEVGGYIRDCAWVLIWKRLEERGKLDLFVKFRPFRVNKQHHPRELELP